MVNVEVAQSKFSLQFHSSNGCSAYCWLIVLMSSEVIMDNSLSIAKTRSIGKLGVSI